MLLNQKRALGLNPGQFLPFGLLYLHNRRSKHSGWSTPVVFGKTHEENGNRHITPRIIQKQKCEARKTLKQFYEELYGRRPEVSF
jgi:hypothetical protein